jgi:hypothetical protein
VCRSRQRHGAFEAKKERGKIRTLHPLHQLAVKGHEDVTYLDVAAAMRSAIGRHI